MASFLAGVEALNGLLLIGWTERQNIGAALVGTMLGVFLSYGMFEPFAGRLGQIVDEESQVYNVIHQMLVAQFKGHPQPVVIEAARACISHHNQPSFSEVFDSLRGG